jgi:hypothetical protein
MHIELSLVIGGTAGKDLSVLNGRVEGTAMPELEGVGRLDIIMPVDKHRGFAGIGYFFAVDDGMAIGRVDFRLVDAGIEQPLFYRIGAFQHIGFVFAAGADGRDTEEFEEFAEETVFVFILIVFPGGHKE